MSLSGIIPYKLSLVPSKLKNYKNVSNLLKWLNEETLCAINDLSEDTQKSLDNIYIALSELATKKKNNAKRPKIGYIK